MKNAGYFILLLLGISFLACNNKLVNPAAEGFNLSGSDQKAIAIADEVMQAMGGRKAWEETRYLTWNFFGSRIHHWDKHTGDIRIVSEKDNYTLLMNIHTMKGKLKKDGEMVTQPDSLVKYMEMGKSAWINDAYWLVMPYKLKDSGVTLKYKGEGKSEKGEASDILELTFSGVGVTPDNKYDVYVDKQTRLVNQWAFYSKYENTEPGFVTAWDDYKKYGGIMLSGGRSKYNLTEIDAPAELAVDLFSKLD
ncbi:MAG: hypothetical protein ACI8P3_000475 [Saprospiraceae bacterium]|jgi:hypothetical protein